MLFKWIRLLQLCVLFFAAVALAEPVRFEIERGKDEARVFAVQGAQREPMGYVRKLKAGTRLYHWTQAPNAERWARQGQVDSGEVDFLVKHGKGAQGGGFYISLDSVNSMKFGTHLVVFEVAEDFEYFSMDRSFMLPGLESKELNEGLRGLGIRATTLGGSANGWYNVLDSAPLSRARKGGIVELIESEWFKNVANFEELVKVDSRIPIIDHPGLREKFPLVAKVIAGEALSADEGKELFGQIRKALWLSSQDDAVPRGAPLLKKLGVALREPIRAFLSEELSKAKNSPWHSEAVFTRAAKFGIPPGEIMGGGAQVPWTSLIDRRLDFHSSDLQSKFGQKLLSTFEFMELDDVLAEMAKGSSAPWAKHDLPGKRPLIERWEQAKKGGDLTQVHRLLIDDLDSGFRDHPVVVGGEIQVNGDGYYRVTARQLDTLQQNPFLVVTSRPDPASPDGRTFLARHEHPSARTYRKFESQLDPMLVKELREAEAAGDLRDALSAKSRSLTKRIVAVLSLKHHNNVLLKYREILSIHPFATENERTARAWLRSTDGPELFLRNWGVELVMTEDELHAQAILGRQQLGAIEDGFKAAEAIHPDMPRFYDRPEAWMIAANREEVPPGFVEESKRRYRAYSGTGPCLSDKLKAALLSD